MRTLTNALASGRLAHAFILTGVRGVGKTTTARIIARALNCVGPRRAPAAPLRRPAACASIAWPSARTAMSTCSRSTPPATAASPRCASSPTGCVTRRSRRATRSTSSTKSTCCRPRPSTRFLKTLEEPPPHVKFVFATTEISQDPRHRAVALPTLRSQAPGYRRHAGVPDRYRRSRKGVRRSRGAPADRARGRGLGARRACRCSIRPSPMAARGSTNGRWGTCSGSPTAAACSSSWTPSSAATPPTPCAGLPT